MNKYSRLKRFLELHREEKVTLTLEQIEMIVDDELPPSARKYHAWWRGPSFHSHVKSWSDIGWSVEVHSEKGSIAWVVFKRNE